MEEEEEEHGADELSRTKVAHMWTHTRIFLLQFPATIRE